MNPKLLEFKKLYETISIIQNWPVSKIFAKISHHLNRAEDHKWKFFKKIRNYDFLRNQILIMNLMIIRNFHAVFEKWYFENFWRYLQFDSVGVKSSLILWYTEIVFFIIKFLYHNKKLKFGKVFLTSIIWKLLWFRT